LMSMPGAGIKTAATIVLTIDNGSSFHTSGHVAAYAGIAPVTRRSGNSIRGNSPARPGQQRTQERTLPVRMDSLLPRPRVQGLLRAETRRRGGSQRRGHPPECSLVFGTAYAGIFLHIFVDIDRRDIYL
jgi:transposase